MAYVDNVLETISAVAGSGLGDVTLSGAVDATYRALGAADDGKSFEVTFVEPGTGTETRTGCVYTHSGRTLSRGTLLSSTTGSAITLTTAATVAVVLSAGTLNELDAQLNRGTIIVKGSASTQSIAASTFTKLTSINVEELDLEGWWDNANARFTPLRAGVYLIIAGSQLTMSSVGTASYLLVARKNGADFAHLARGWVTDGGNIGVSGSCLMEFNGTTDYCEPFGWQNSAVSQNTVAGSERQFFMATFLGG
jgi:hypothetical protein